MKKKLIEILSLVLTGIIGLSPLTAYALDEDTANISYQESSEESTQTTIVRINKGSHYTVLIPKTIIMGANDNNTNYIVKVTGDIAGDEVVNVVPDNSVLLKQGGKQDVIAPITQEVKSFNTTMLNQSVFGTINVDNISAGNWEGRFDFNIYLSKSEMVLGDLVLPEVDTWDSLANGSKQLSLNDTQTVHSTYNNEDISSNLTITSSNEGIVEIKGNKIKPLKVGETVITVSFEINGEVKSYSYTLTVSRDDVSSSHKHETFSVVKENIIEATCTNTGSCDEVVYCTGCDKELYRQAESMPALGHDYVNHVCSRCGQKDAWGEIQEAAGNGTLSEEFNNVDNITSLIDSINANSETYFIDNITSSTKDEDIENVLREAGYGQMEILHNVPINVDDTTTYSWTSCTTKPRYIIFPENIQYKVSSNNELCAYGLTSSIGPLSDTSVSGAVSSVYARGDVIYLYSVYFAYDDWNKKIGFHLDRRINNVYAIAPTVVLIY